MYRRYLNHKVDYEKRIDFDSNGRKFKDYSVDSTGKWLFGTSITFPDSLSERRVYSQLDGKHYYDRISIYDQSNRFLGSIESSSNEEHPVKRFAFYDANDRLSTVYTIKGNDTFLTAVEYDTNGRRVSENHFNEKKSLWLSFSFEYDKIGNCLNEFLFYYPKKIKTQKNYAYDSLNRRIKFDEFSNGKRIKHKVTDYSHPHLCLDTEYFGHGYKSVIVSDSLSHFSEIRIFGRYGRLISSHKVQSTRDAYDNWITRLRKREIPYSFLWLFKRKKIIEFTQTRKIEYYSESQKE